MRFSNIAIRTQKLFELDLKRGDLALQRREFRKFLTRHEMRRGFLLECINEDEFLGKLEGEAVFLNTEIIGIRHEHYEHRSTIAQRRLLTYVL
jgi:hypothetical protein